MTEIKNVARTVAIIAAVILIAALAFKALVILTAIVFKIITLAVVVGLLWVVFMLARYTYERRGEAS